ncbi:hypothetical protein BDB01DRAFT_770382 [Pilobolus umbonatus]|nr:hypothetical protein BDB01DRAFT_770382 [Pilobolus umbonatus]
METKQGKSLYFLKKNNNSTSSIPIKPFHAGSGVFSRVTNQFTSRSTPTTPVHSPSVEFKDNPLTSDDQSLRNDINEVTKAINYFGNSDIIEAEAIIQPRHKSSMYHSLGFSFISYLRCVMTFQKDDIVAALEVLKQTIALANQQRKKDNGWYGSITGWMKGTTVEDIKSMTVVQRHAELIHAEAYLLKALLSIIHDESVMSFLRESLNIRSSYTSYMILEKYVDYVRENEPTELDEDLASGVALGVGCFSLILSLLPASVVKLAEFVGFSADKSHGLKVLERVGGWDKQHGNKDVLLKDGGGLRRQLCDMVLIVYHIVLSKMIPLSDVDIPFAEKILRYNLELYPNGVFFLYFNGRNMFSKRELDEAIVQYQRAIDAQQDWKQLHHMCYWDLGIIYMIQQDYKKSYDTYNILSEESNWSKAVYSYAKAINLYNLHKGDTPRTNEVKLLMQQVTGERQKIAGKSIPIEKFVARKARKFLLQNNYLLLPDLELLNIFSAYDFMPIDTLEKGMKRIDHEIRQLEERKEDAYYDDDLCLASYLQAITARMLNEQGHEVDRMHQIHTRAIERVFSHAEKIVLDHYVYYFSHYENACMLILDEKYDMARSELQIILKANDKGQYNVGSGPHSRSKYSLANALVFKCHNCMAKIKEKSQ